MVFRDNPTHAGPQNFRTLICDGIPRMTPVQPSLEQGLVNAVVGMYGPDESFVEIMTKTVPHTLMVGHHQVRHVPTLGGVVGGGTEESGLAIDLGVDPEAPSRRDLRLQDGVVGVGGDAGPVDVERPRAVDEHVLCDRGLVTGLAEKPPVLAGGLETRPEMGVRTGDVGRVSELRQCLGDAVGLREPLAVARHEHLAVASGYEGPRGHLHAPHDAVVGDRLDPHQIGGGEP